MKLRQRTAFIFFCLISSGSVVAQDSLRVSASSLEAGRPAVYTLSFVTADTLGPEGQISLSFPPNMDISELKIASSTTINGGFKVQTQGQDVFLTRTGLGRSIAPGERVDIKFAVVKNPSDATTKVPLQIEFDHKSKLPISLSRRRKQIELSFQEKSK